MPSILRFFVDQISARSRGSAGNETANARRQRMIRETERSLDDALAATRPQEIYTGDWPPTGNRGRNRNTTRGDW